MDYVIWRDGQKGLIVTLYSDQVDEWRKSLAENGYTITKLID